LTAVFLLDVLKESIMKNFTIFLSCALILAASFGCTKKNARPADLPEDMSPCSITITQDGTPVEGATVALEYETPVKYQTSGTTDAKGVAIMMTYGHAGAQQGTAKVLVSKLVTEGASEAEDYGESGEMGQDFETIDLKYKAVDTTDLTITIGKDNVAESFEVGAPVRIPAN
jgi:hypothetical protein